MTDWKNRIVGEGEEAPDQLLANPLNFRVHPGEQQQAMTGALEEIGWIQRVVVNRRTGHVIDGHLRVQLALRASAASVPVVYVDLSEEEERLALATFDPISGMAGTDQALLKELLGGVGRGNEALRPLLDDLAKKAKGVLEAIEPGHADPDAVPPLRANPVSRVGDVWILGEHRLVVGDATDANVYAVLLQGEQADCVWTDPPYNVAYVGKAGTVANDDLERADFADFLKRAFACVTVSLKDGGAFYVAHGDGERPAFQAALEDNDLQVKQCLIWVKNSAVLSRQDYNWRHEPILYGWRAGAAHYFGFDFSETTVVDETADLKKLSREQLENLCSVLLQRPATTAHYHNRPARSELHPTMKPVALVAQHVANSTRRGEVVLDPFGGSGSTLIACGQIGRAARLIELDPGYADVIVERWQKWAAETAVLEDGGKAFAAVAGARKVKRQRAAEPAVE